MVKRPVKYFVVDAFTDTAFKGNPAAVCLLEKEEEQDEKWMQAVAREFNISQTCFLTPISSTQSDANDRSVTRFHLRWFTPLIEVKLCGHGTLASAHFLFAYRIARTDVIEFVTLSGILIAKRIPTGSNNVDASKFSDGDPEEHFSIELDFPAFPVLECESEIFHHFLKPRMALRGYFICVGLNQYARRSMQDPVCGSIHCALVPYWSKKLGKCDFVAYMDPVCGSAHCALVPYWSKKLGKCDLVAYMASPRGGVLDLHLDEANQRVLIRGKAVVVMEVSFVPLSSCAFED
ncbi:phenazine biosynthesis-like domain-containing protein 1 [Telopea speciosissima]|uniref:phenazine biosynthesis-like domain-containing protein 1 n=1 Tax=Telopea speciosissima TaxID=54955 RepID=UPI001CC3648C|nr:phenazine biosynthesis-like domain-containing protein 1 [Telopea speciosissima]